MQVIEVHEFGGPEVLQVGEADLPQPRQEVWCGPRRRGRAGMSRFAAAADRQLALRPRRRVSVVVGDTGGDAALTMGHRYTAGRA
jgi:hypothetical protein